MFTLKPNEIKATLGKTFDNEFFARAQVTWEFIKNPKLVVGYFEELKIGE